MLCNTSARCSLATNRASKGRARCSLSPAPLSARVFYTRQSFAAQSSANPSCSRVCVWCAGVPLGSRFPAVKDPAGSIPAFPLRPGPPPCSAGGGGPRALRTGVRAEIGEILPHARRLAAPSPQSSFSASCWEGWGCLRPARDTTIARDTAHRGTRPVLETQPPQRHRQRLGHGRSQDIAIARDTADPWTQPIPAQSRLQPR